ncbi:MAG TPA: polysaccharide deacetylase family protein [Patescibacteria group bacterium]|nr:polysaccharide deacetylase family protein [Patescibacteria group bacterium]
MNKKIIVTTSWDDGHKLDRKLALLLKKYNIKGTLYVSPLNHEFAKKDLLSKIDMVSLSKNFEIGAHTMHHLHLSQIPLQLADKEIRDSKKYLENIIHKRVQSFCYPYGDYNENIAKLVEKNGFLLARTTKRYSFVLPDNLFSIPTTFHTYNHYSDIHKVLQFSGLHVSRILRYTSWDNLAKDLFDYTAEKKTVFHLWGHSWEFEKFNSWEKLENVFRYIANRKNVYYMSNAEAALWANEHKKQQY